MPSNGKRTASRRLNAVKWTLRGQTVHFVVVVAVNVVDLHLGLAVCWSLFLGSDLLMHLSDSGGILSEELVLLEM